MIRSARNALGGTLIGITKGAVNAIGLGRAAVTVSIKAGGVTLGRR